MIKNNFTFTVFFFLGCTAPPMHGGAFFSKIAPYATKLTNRLSEMLDETARAAENPMEAVRLNTIAHAKKQNPNITEEPCCKEYFRTAISKGQKIGKLDQNGNILKSELHLFGLPFEVQSNILECLRTESTYHLAGTFQQHFREIKSLAILPEDLLASSSYRTIKIWNYRTGTYERTLGGGLSNDHWIWTLAALPNGKIASGGYDKTIKIWDTKTGVCLKTLHGHEELVSSCAVLSEDRLASGSSDGTIKIWDTTTGRCMGTLRTEPDDVHITPFAYGVHITSLAYLGKNLLASGSFDTTIKIWDISTGQCLRTLNGHTRRITSLACLGNNLLASGSIDGTIKIWNTIDGACVKTLDEFIKVTALVVLSDGTLVSGSGRGNVKFWNPKTGECQQTLCRRAGEISSLAVSKNGRLFSASSDKTIKIWRSMKAFGHSCEPSLPKPFYTKAPLGFFLAMLTGISSCVPLGILTNLIVKLRLNTASPREICLSAGSSILAGIAAYKFLRKALDLH